MKLITHAQGAVAMYGPADEVCPEGGLLQRDLIQFVGDAYKFAVKPLIPSGVAEVPTLQFQSGKLEKAKEEYPVHQMFLMQNGDAVTALTTDAAEIVLTDLIARLEAGLRFRYGDTSGRRKTYYSGLVVQFDAAIEDRIPTFGRIEKLLNAAIPRENMPFKPKVIAFGYGDPIPLGITSVDDLLKADFSIQRRVGAPYSENRYFSSAPLPTKDHLKLLQEIEAALG